MADKSHLEGSGTDKVTLQLTRERIAGFLRQVDENRPLLGEKSLDDIVAHALSFVDRHFPEFVESYPLKSQESR